MQKSEVYICLLVFTTAVFSAGLGVGGGAILVPMLFTLFKWEYRRAAALSLAAIVPVAMTGGISHLLLLDGVFPVVQLAGFVLMIIAGSRFAGRWLHRIDSRFLQTAFGVFIFIIGLKMVHIINLPGALFHLFPKGSTVEMVLLAGFGLMIGAVSVLLGVGCGLLIVPFLHFVFGYPIKAAITFSLLAIFINTLNATLIHCKLRLIKRNTLALILPAALSGAITGTLISNALPAQTLKTGFGIFLLVMGANFIIRDAVKQFNQPQPAETPGGTK